MIQLTHSTSLSRESTSTIRNLKAGGGFHHYLPIDDEVFHSGIYVTSAGYGIVQPDQKYPAERHPPLYQFDWEEGRILPEFSLMLITAGQGTFESKEMKRVPLNRKTAVLLFPDVWHRYQPEKRTGWTEKWVQFNGEFAHRLFEEQFINPEQAVLHPADWGLLERAFDRFLRQIHRDPTKNSLLWSLQAMQLLCLAIGSSPLALNSGKTTNHRAEADPLVSAALDYVWTRSHQVLSVRDVAEHLGVTRRTLERHMALAHSHTVLQEIVRCRFSRAERLLRETALPITTVVTLAGFGSSENMRQSFLRRTGFSPRDYRQRHRPTGC